MLVALILPGHGRNSRMEDDCATERAADRESIHNNCACHE
jgi:hypothetical protein